MRTPLVTLVCISMVIGCASSETEDSSNVNQDRIFQLHTANFDAVNGEFKWTASFTLGGATGTTLELVNGSSVTVNNQTMEKLTTGVSGTFYIRKEQTKISTEPQTFQWKDTSGKAFNNSISLNTVAFPSDFKSSFSKSQDITIAWAGDKLSGTYDWISLEIKAKANNELAIKRINDSGATSISVSAKDLAKLGVGDIELQLSRYSGWIDLKEATSVGGSIGYNYYSDKKTAILTE